jgi:phospholipase/lecithinase/hemolysin
MMKLIASCSQTLKIVGGCMALGMTVLVPSAAFAGKPSQVIMLGDSAADSGTYDGERPVNDGNLWIETVARHLHMSMSAARSISSAVDADATITATGGNNYAASGATVSQYFPFPYVTFSDEVRWLKEDHATIDKDELVFLQFDSNDAAYSVLLGIPYDPKTYANEYIANVYALKEMGARNMVAMGDTASLLPEGLYTSPEVGLSPEIFEAHRERMLASR